MRRPTAYEQTLERLKTQGTREQECFSRAVTALRGKGTAAEFSATITDARAAIDKLVQDPELFTSRRAAVVRLDAATKAYVPAQTVDATAPALVLRPFHAPRTAA